jgi:hypothetical protein
MTALPQSTRIAPFAAPRRVVGVGPAGGGGL